MLLSKGSVVSRNDRFCDLRIFSFEDFNIQGIFFNGIYGEKVFLNLTSLILMVEDCMNSAICDWDGDGQNEAVVRTRWEEKPYTVYDMVDGEIVAAWPDAVPQEVQDKLVCIWEQ